MLAFDLGAELDASANDDDKVLTVENFTLTNNSSLERAVELPNAFCIESIEERNMLDHINT